MDLLPDEVAKTIPPLYAQEHVEEKIAYVKYTHPLLSWAWYVMEVSAILNDGRTVPYDVASELCRLQPGINPESALSEKGTEVSMSSLSESVNSQDSETRLLQHKRSKESQLERGSDDQQGIYLSQEPDSSSPEQSRICETGKSCAGEDNRTIHDEGGTSSSQKRKQNGRQSGKSSINDDKRTQALSYVKNKPKETHGKPLCIVDFLFFGFVAGDFPELGYFSLDEFILVGDVIGVPMERDLDFKPMKLSEILTLHGIML